MAQTVTTLAIVAAAAAYLVVRAVQLMRPQDGCGGGCGSACAAPSAPPAASALDFQPAPPRPR